MNVLTVCAHCYCFCHNKSFKGTCMVYSSHNIKPAKKSDMIKLKDIYINIYDRSFLCQGFDTVQGRVVALGFRAQDTLKRTIVFYSLLVLIQSKFIYILLKRLCNRGFH